MKTTTQIIIVLVLSLICFIIRDIYRAGINEGYRMKQIKATYDSIK